MKSSNVFATSVVSKATVWSVMVSNTTFSCDMFRNFFLTRSNFKDENKEKNQVVSQDFCFLFEIEKRMFQWKGCVSVFFYFPVILSQDFLNSNLDFSVINFRFLSGSFETQSTEY